MQWSTLQTKHSDNFKEYWCFFLLFNCSFMHKAYMKEKLEYVIKTAAAKLHACTFRLKVRYSVWLLYGYL